MIQVENLTKTFDQFTAVKDISFQVDSGEIFAFLGPNGAGKTTTIKMLTTLLRPTSGHIHLDGFDPWVKQRDARQRFGIVFQDPSLDNEQTAYENMELHGILYHIPRRTRIERIEQLLRLFELWERRNDYVKTFSASFTFFTCDHNWLRLCGSSPSVGSSRKRILGVCRNPRAISRRRFIPPENFFTTSLRRSQSSNCFSSSSVRCLRTLCGTW